MTFKSWLRARESSQSQRPSDGISSLSINGEFKIVVLIWS